MDWLHDISYLLGRARDFAHGVLTESTKIPMAESVGRKAT